MSHSMRDSKRRGDGLSTHPDELRQHDDEIGREAQIQEHKDYVDTVLKAKGLYP